MPRGLGTDGANAEGWGGVGGLLGGLVPHRRLEGVQRVGFPRGFRGVKGYGGVLERYGLVLQAAGGWAGPSPGAGRGKLCWAQLSQGGCLETQAAPP